MGLWQTDVRRQQQGNPASPKSIVLLTRASFKPNTSGVVPYRAQMQ